MVKKYLILLTVAFSFSCALFMPFTTSAQECDTDCSVLDETEQPSCLADKISCLSGKINSLKQEKSTLTGSINVLNGSINIQELKIKQKTSEIAVLEKELTNIDQRLDGLTISLDRLSTLLIERVQSHYKQQKISPLLLLLNSDSLDTYLLQKKYFTQTSKQTADAMSRAHTQKVIYDDQKLLKEEKQDELSEVKRNLQNEQQALLNTKSEKQKLLELTQNDEKKFQQLLSDAEKQLASFRRFVSTQGGASILSGQTSCDDWGCYYNQRDSQWGNQLIGRSSSSMAEYGCLVTSMAMMATHQGKSLTPGQIAASSNPFFHNTAYMLQGTWTVNGVSMTRTRIGYSTGTIDNELANNRAVVVGIGSGPDHFLVITKKENGQYIMRDPYTANGKDIPFTDKYSLGSISAVDRVTAN